MKQTLLCIFTFFVSLSAFSQSHRFADSTAQWYMTTYDNALFCGGCTSYHTDLFSAGADTIFGGQTYQKVNNAFIRRDTIGKVYRFFNAQETMIYDFSKVAGDTFTLHSLFGGGMDVLCQVDSVDTILLNYPRKLMYVTYNGNNFLHEQWIDGIGSLKSDFLNPGVELMMFDMPSHNLRCFHEEDSLLLHTDTVDTRCDVDTFIPPPPPPHWFADSSAQWNVLHIQWCMTAPCIHFNTYSQYIGADTIINGMQYQIIEGEYGFGSVRRPFIRKDSNGKVFMLGENSTCETIIYDFSAVPGDTISINYECGQSIVQCRVDSVDSVNLGGIRKRMYVKYGVNGNWFGYPNDVWIDGLGTLEAGDLGAPAFAYRFTDGGSYEIRCFTERNILLYHDTSYSNVCDFDSSWVSINEVQSIAASISPNPTTNNFTLTLNQQPQAGTILLIHDALCRIVRLEELISSTQQISVADLPNGMYTFSVTQNNARQASGKLVIAK